MSDSDSKIKTSEGEKIQEWNEKALEASKDSEVKKSQDQPDVLHGEGTSAPYDETRSTEAHETPQESCIKAAREGDSENKSGGGPEDDVTLTFPQKLMEILDDEHNEQIISWLPHGNGFMIYKKKQFETDLMPKFFNKHSKYTSFTRKLNRWGFVRVTRGPEMGAYYHKFFKRGNTTLCTQMSCNKFNSNEMIPMGNMAQQATLQQLSSMQPNNNVGLQFQGMNGQNYLQMQQQQHMQLLMRHREQMLQQREAMMLQQQAQGVQNNGMLSMRPVGNFNMQQIMQYQAMKPQQMTGAGQQSDSAQQQQQQQQQQMMMMMMPSGMGMQNFQQMQQQRSQQMQNPGQKKTG